jgi:tetratricopeptide (TPR) repeat protein
MNTFKVNLNTQIMRVLNIFLIFIFIGGAIIPCYAQTKIIDGLKNDIRAAKSDGEKLKALFSLCELGYTLHPDTLMLYAEKAKEIALQQKILKDEVRVMYFKSGALTTKGLLDSALALANECLEILTSKINDPILEANCYNQKGRCFVRKNQYKEAIDMGLKTISIAEKNNDILLQVKGKTLIGWAYLEMDQLPDAQLALKVHTTSDTLLLENIHLQS